MIVLSLIAFGFGIFCCLLMLAPVAALLRAIRRAAPKAAGLRALTYGYAALCAAWAGYWCVLILETCWVLVSKDGGPGPFGLLIFPFWALIAVVPALIGLGLLRLLKMQAASR
jgi:hypothetical protein